MRAFTLALAVLALAAVPVLAENAPAKAENFLSFYADDVTLSNGDTLVFTNPSQELSTSFGDVNLAKTFAPGAFKPTQKADGVIKGTTADGRKVETVLRFSEPEFADGKLTVKVEPFDSKEMKPTLEGGYVSRALANPAFTPMSKDLQTAHLDKVDVIVDSKAPPKREEEAKTDAQADAATPATAATGRRLLYDGNVAHQEWNEHHDHWG